MRLYKTVVWSSLIFLAALPAAAQNSSVTKLENEIRTMVAGRDASSADQNALRNLNILKVQLLNAIEVDLSELEKDAAIRGIGDRGRAAIQDAKKQNEDEKNSVYDSLGKWTTGLPAEAAGASASVPPAPLIPTNSEAPNPANVGSSLGTSRSSANAPEPANLTGGPGATGPAPRPAAAAAPKESDPPDNTAQGPCSGAKAPSLSKIPVVGTEVLTGCAKQKGDFVFLADLQPTDTPDCSKADYSKSVAAPVDDTTQMFSFEVPEFKSAKGEKGVKGLQAKHLVCLKEVDSSGQNAVYSVGPEQVQAMTYSESDTPWGRVRPYLSAGAVFSQSNGQFSNQDLFLSLNLDKNWFKRTNRRSLQIMLNTYFTASLTSIPAAACQSSGTGSSGSNSSNCPTPAGTNTNNLSNFIASQKAGVIEGGIYLPMYGPSLRWSYQGYDNALFLAPIFKGGYQTLINGTQTVSSPTPGVTTTTSTLNNQSLYYFYAGGVRLGHYKLFDSWNIAPDLVSYLDIAFGKWQNFEQCAPQPSMMSCVGGSTPSPTVLPTMVALSGRLKVPATFLQVGFDAMTPLTKTTGTKGDLRFYFGVVVDPGCVFKAIQGTATSLTTCEQGQSGSSAAGTTTKP